MWDADTVTVLGAGTCSKIPKYPNIRSANPLICCKIAKYPNIWSVNPLICYKIAKYPISESYTLYPNFAGRAAKAKHIRFRYTFSCLLGESLVAAIALLESLHSEKFDLSSGINVTTYFSKGYGLPIVLVFVSFSHCKLEKAGAYHAKYLVLSVT
jgi:hypothetical protein